MPNSNFAELNKVEIFREGTYYNDTYTEAELDEIVASTTALLAEGKHRCPAKLGHDEAQEYAKANGLPAVGWVTKLWREGKSLFADFKEVPKIVEAAIRAKLYDGVSCEIYSQGMSQEEFGVKKLAMRAVAFLGADVPKVKGMLPLSVALASEKELTFAAVKFSEGKLVIPFEEPTTERLTPGADAPPKDKIKEAQMAEVDEKIKELSERHATELAESQKKELAERTAREALENKVLDGTMKAFFETHKEVILPAQHERITALVKAAKGVVKLGEKEESVQETLIALLGEIATSRGVSLKEETEGTETAVEGDEVKALEESYKPHSDAKVEGADIAVAAKKYAEEHGCSYRDALRIVVKKEAK